MQKQRLLPKLKKGIVLAGIWTALALSATASSHREAPLISNDPLADNTDLYAFKSPNDNNSSVTIIANFIPFELPEGGPSYYTFGDDVRYEIHIKNNPNTTGDDITYRFTFSHVNQDPSTFFLLRLGMENRKTTYTCEKITNGGSTIQTIISNGVVPPTWIGNRSFAASNAGLGDTYKTVRDNAVLTASTGENVFCGPADDPFFVDLAGAFDVGNFRPQGNSTNPPKDAVARYNVHSIALKIPVSMLQVNGLTAQQAANILDPNFVIGVWASASRKQVKTLDSANGPSASGNWVQVSRIGMPLTNEVIIPIGQKDKWNATTPYNDLQYAKYFTNPELALYMDDSQFGTAVPALGDLRIQTNSLGMFDFRNTKKGLFGLKGNPALVGTAFDPATFGNILLPDSTSPRSVDILPIFYTGVPNLPPYQLATGKPAGNPLAAGKPFINNFMPTLGDMLRLNMAVPVTPRSSSLFSPMGLVDAAVKGLTLPQYANTNIQMIPNMDGFPNGRRLEDDITTIELMAVSGVTLAAIGLWYDDYTIGGTPLTPQLLKVLNFTAGPTQNDTTFRLSFPYVQLPWRGSDYSQQPRF